MTESAIIEIEKDEIKDTINELKSIIERLGLIKPVTKWNKIFDGLEDFIGFISDKIPMAKILN